MIVVTDVMQLLLVAIDLDRALVTSRRTSSPNSGGTTFVDYDVFSHRSPAQLLERRAEATSLSSVCRRVLVPTILETVILNSELEAKTFVYMLRLKHVRPYIKKLRIEGGLFTQFSRISLDSRLSVSLFLQKIRRVVSAAFSNSSTLSTSSFVTLMLCVTRELVMSLMFS